MGELVTSSVHSNLYVLAFKYRNIVCVSGINFTGPKNASELQIYSLLCALV
jgi:hypothetical protein